MNCIEQDKVPGVLDTAVLAFRTIRHFSFIPKFSKVGSILKKNNGKARPDWTTLFICPAIVQSSHDAGTLRKLNCEQAFPPDQGDLAST